MLFTQHVTWGPVSIMINKQEKKIGQCNEDYERHTEVCILFFRAGATWLNSYIQINTYFILPGNSLLER